jgi:restriction system protein
MSLLIPLYGLGYCFYYMTGRPIKGLLWPILLYKAYWKLLFRLGMFPFKIIWKLIKALRQHKQGDFSLEQVDKIGKGTRNEKGRQFEDYICQLYRTLGYEAYTTTELRQLGKLPEIIQRQSGVGEQGVDVVLFSKEDGQTRSIIIQCKHYQSKVSNSAVQEIVSAIPLYQAQLAVVITNNYFTEPAHNLAKANNVLLIDRYRLSDLIKSVNKNRYKDHRRAYV